MTAVEVAHATKAYSDGDHPVTALQGVNLSIAPGEFISVIGPSGCGKSTLLRLIGGLEKPDAGRIEIFGHSPAVAQQAKQIGLVPQRPALLPWLSVEANVTLPLRLNAAADHRRRSLTGVRRIDRPDPVELLEAVGLTDVRRARPGQLSGGMQQRVAIARAFALGPDLLLLDEPFSALDEFTREALQDRLLRLWERQRTTVVFVTHSVAEAARLSDRVVVMAPHPGRIIEVAPIALPRPRTGGLLQTSDFHDQEDRLRNLLGSAWRAPLDDDRNGDRR